MTIVAGTQFKPAILPEKKQLVVKVVADWRHFLKEKAIVHVRSENRSQQIALERFGLVFKVQAVQRLRSS